MNEFPPNDYIRRLIRDIQRVNLQFAASQIAPIARQLQEFQKSVVGAEVMRSVAALHESLVPRIPDLAQMFNTINAEWTREILASAAELARAARELRERAFPPNWSAFSGEEIDAILKLMDETGWSLVWVPRAEVIRQLLDAEDGDRPAVLVNSDEEIVADLDAALEAVRHTQLVELRDALSQAVGAYRAGFPGPAQSHAAAVFTTTMHVHLELKNFRAAREEFEMRDPMDVELMLFKLAAIYKTAARAIATYWGDDQEPIPTSFNRHASAHRVSEVQYTKVNALAALLLATSLLRELEPLLQLQVPENSGT
jgi:hypothetical protein